MPTKSQSKGVGKNSGNSLPNVAYCLLTCNGKIYLEIKRGKGQIFGRKISASYSKDEMIKGLIDSVYEKTGVTLEASAFEEASSKPFHDTDEGAHHVSQKCFVFKVDLTEPLKPEKFKNIIAIKKDDILKKQSSLPLMKISENIINYLR